ncbi:MAG: electron transfer flavoprotein subunit alpha/FixB family protein [Pirellulales bacterium]
MSDVVCGLLARSGLDRAAQGVLGTGRRLADRLGGKLRVVIVGPADDGLTNGAAAVADAVTVIDHPLLAEYHPEHYLSALAQACRPLAPRVVLLANDTYSQELAARLAHRLGGSTGGDAVDVSPDGDTLRVTRGVYGGKAVAVISLKRTPAVVWLRARAMAPADVAGRALGSIEKATLDLPADERVKVVSRHVEAREGVRLEDARIIVSGGRGLGGPEPFQLLQALADAMGAQMAASRAACDAGWVPPSWQVGQTGKKVAPELYLAIAISGASQHIMGIADSKVICAINLDADAPIFKHCRFGLVADYQKVVGPLRDKLSQST